MDYIFIIPEVVPSTSSTKKFYNVDNYISKVSEISYCSWPIFTENVYWTNVVYYSFRNMQSDLVNNKTNKYENAIKISNLVFEKIKKDLYIESVNMYAAFKYFWNRLAYRSGRLDMVIDRVLIRKNANFRPNITTSKLYKKEVKTLIINSTYIEYKQDYVFLRYIQLLFLYISDPVSRDVYGRYLKEKYTSGRIINCPVKYDNTLYEYNCEKQYSIVQHNTIDNFVRSSNDKRSISNEDKKVIENLNESQLLKAYSYIIEMIHKG